MFRIFVSYCSSNMGKNVKCYFVCASSCLRPVYSIHKFVLSNLASEQFSYFFFALNYCGMMKICEWINGLSAKRARLARERKYRIRRIDRVETTGTCKKQKLNIYSHSMCVFFSLQSCYFTKPTKNQRKRNTHKFKQTQWNQIHHWEKNVR